MIGVFWHNEEVDGLSGPDSFILIDGDQGDNSTWQTDPRHLTSISMKPMGDRQTRKEADGNKEADGSSMVYLDLHGYLYKEIYCIPRLTLIKGTLIRKGSRKIRKLMRIFLTRK